MVDRAVAMPRPYSRTCLQGFGDEQLAAANGREHVVAHGEICGYCRRERASGPVVVVSIDGIGAQVCVDRVVFDDQDIGLVVFVVRIASFKKNVSASERLECPSSAISACATRFISKQIGRAHV